MENARTINSKTKLGLSLIFLLIMALTIHFVIRENSKIAEINRMIPLKIPKHAELLNYLKVGQRVYSVIRIDSSIYGSFWENYYSDKRTREDLENKISIPILAQFKQYSPEDSLKYFFRQDCERGVVYACSATPGKEFMLLQLDIPDWKSIPDCEKLFLNKG